MGMLKRIFPLLMTTSLERKFSLEKPREGKMAFKPLHLFTVVCSECEYIIMWSNALRWYEKHEPYETAYSCSKLRLNGNIITI